MIGCLPWSATDATIVGLTAWVPLICLSPADGSVLVAGPDDPGGLGWTWRTLVTTIAAAGVMQLLSDRRLRRRR